MLPISRPWTTAPQIPERTKLSVNMAIVDLIHCRVYLHQLRRDLVRSGICLRQLQGPKR